MAVVFDAFASGEVNPLGEIGHRSTIDLMGVAANAKAEETAVSSGRLGTRRGAERRKLVCGTRLIPREGDPRPRCFCVEEGLNASDVVGSLRGDLLARWQAITVVSLSTFQTVDQCGRLLSRRTRLRKPGFRRGVLGTPFVIDNDSVGTAHRIMA